MSEFTPGIQKVIDHVARTDGWHLVFSRRMLEPTLLRRPCPNEAHACPVTSPLQVEADAVAEFDEDDLDRLGITRDDMDAIVDASDFRPDCNLALRFALLKAARLA